MWPHRWLSAIASATTPTRRSPSPAPSRRPTPTISADATLGDVPADPLALTDWDQDGLEVEFGALIEANAPVNIFQRAPRTALGSLEDGELDVDSDGTEITRVAWFTSNSQLRLFDSDTSFDINAFFATGGEGHDLTLRFQTTPDNAVEVNVTDVYSGGNSSRAHFDMSTAMTALLNTVGDGDLFIIGAYREPSLDPLDLAGTVTAADASITAAATLGDRPAAARCCRHRHGR